MLCVICTIFPFHFHKPASITMMICYSYKKYAAILFVVKSLYGDYNVIERDNMRKIDGYEAMGYTKKCRIDFMYDTKCHTRKAK